MGEQAARVLAEALKLSAEERLQLAEELYESLSAEAMDPEIEAAWAKEIERRIQDLRSGKVEGIPADEVFARIRSQLAARSG